MRTEYLWTVYLEQGGNVRRVFAELKNQWNPYDTSHSRTYTLEHLDDLNEVVCRMSTGLVQSWWPELSSTSIKKLDDIKTATESGGIRLRGGIIGLVPPSKELFLGNIYRYGLEVSGIYYSLPMQYEIVVDYDFGKRSGNLLVYGRYLSLLARYNIMSIPYLVNVRLYAGAGVSALNIVRVAGSVGGQLKFGIPISVGGEIPFTPQVYLDLCAQLIYSFSDVGPGHFSPADFPVGRLTFVRLGFGIGYRFFH